MTAPRPVHGPSGDAVHDNPDLWLPRLGRILDDQLALYERLEALSERQSEVVENGDADALMGLLAQRQTIVDRVTALNADLEPFTSRWDELSRRIPPDRKDEVRRRLDRLGVLVSSIAQRDDRDRATLERRRDAVSAEINQLSRGGSAVNAYANAQRDTHIPRYQDRRG